MKELAKKFGLGFAYNDFDDTDDFMNWIQCRESTQTFIENVMRHSWKIKRIEKEYNYGIIIP